MKRVKGYAYLDVLVATAVLVISLLPAMSAMHSANLAQREAAETTRLFRHVSSKMVMVLARGSHQLGQDIGANTDLSDAAGSADRRIVQLSFFDADNFDGDDNHTTGAEDELVLITVSLEDGRHLQQTVVSML